MDRFDLVAALDHLAAHHYIIQEREIVAATGRSLRTVRAWMADGAPGWVWGCVLAYRGIFEVGGEYWRVLRDSAEIITPDRDIRRLGEIRGLQYIIGAKNSYRAKSERLARRCNVLMEENARLRAERKRRPMLAANDEF